MDEVVAQTSLRLGNGFLRSERRGGGDRLQPGENSLGQGELVVQAGEEEGQDEELVVVHKPGGFVSREVHHDGLVQVTSQVVKSLAQVLRLIRNN